MGIEKLSAGITRDIPLPFAERTAKAAKAKSAAQPAKASARTKQAPAVPAVLDPASVPWFDESYSFADRERELALLDNLLTTQLSGIRRERAFIRQQIASGDFGLPVLPAQAADTEADSADTADNADHKE